MEGIRGEDTIAELCRREGIAQSLYYKWSKKFLETGKSRMAGDLDEARHLDADRVLGLDRPTR
jgi:transposase